MKKSFTLICLIGLITLLPESIMSQPNFPFMGYDGNPVLTKTPGSWDEGCVFLASPFYYDGEYYLYYAGSEGNPIYSEISLGYAISVDGFNYDKWEYPVMEADNSGFDSLGLGKCVVIVLEDEFRMYYNGIDLIPTPGPGTCIGYASATDPTGPWTRQEEPVTCSGSFGEWDAGCMEPEAVIKVDSGFLMFYFGIHSLPINTNGCIGMAYSADGINWEKYDDPETTSMPYAESDPVLMPGEPGTWDEKTFLGCSVIKTLDTLRMFYTGINLNNEYAIGFATSTNGIEWTKMYSIDPYTYMDDPYALENEYYTVEEPGVILNADSSEYFMYYDYGLTVGEIGLATAPNLTVGITEHNYLNELTNCTIYPNPTAGIFNLRFTIYGLQSVSIDIVDLHGREVESIMDKQLPAGEHQITWDANGLTAGIYFVRIVSEMETVTHKLVIH